MLELSTLFGIMAHRSRASWTEGDKDNKYGSQDGALLLRTSQAWVRPVTNVRKFAPAGLELNAGRECSAV